MRRLVSVISAAIVISASLAATGLAVGASTQQTFPTVTGSFDHTPTVTFPKVPAPTTLEMKVLDQGSGAIVKKSDLLVVNYLGQIWGGKTFDSSFGRQLFGTAIGVGQVIPGWDKTLVGQRVGTRMVLVLPPVDAYPKGNTGAGITAKDTITFVIDLVAAYTKYSEGDAHATHIANSANGVSVSGTLAAQPTIAVAKGTRDPKAVTVTLLDKGHGPVVKPGLIVLQTIVTDWTGKVQASTWALGTPDAETVGNKSAPSALDALVGKTVGSRLLIEIPKSGTSGPFAVALDIIAQPHGTSSQPS